MVYSKRIRLNFPISAFYPHFSVLSPFQRFIPISAFYPHFSVLSPFQCFIPISAFYPHFSVLSPFQRFIPISAFYPHFSVLSPFQRFIPISVSAFSFRFRDSVSAFYPYPFKRSRGAFCSYIFTCLQCFCNENYAVLVFFYVLLLLPFSSFREACIYN